MESTGPEDVRRCGPSSMTSKSNLMPAHFQPKTLPSLHKLYPLRVMVAPHAYQPPARLSSKAANIDLALFSLSLPHSTQTFL